jgi:HlyD family secretion protein
MTMSTAVATYDAADPSRRLPVLVPERSGAAQRADAESLYAACAGPASVGHLVTIIFIAVFMLWGGFIPLAGGAIGAGIIAPEGSRKTVQHLEGGIIARLEVKDGDDVTAGQPLVVLDSVQPQTNVDILRGQRLRLVAKQARLEAEITGAKQIVFPAELIGPDSKLDPAAQPQLQMFETRRWSMQARKNVLRQRLEQLSEQIKGYQAQAQSANHQLALVREESQVKSSLMLRGLISKPEAMRLQRLDAEITGRQGELLSNISRSQQQIGETNMQLLQIDAERIDQIADELDKVRLELADLRQKLMSGEDVLRRMVIAAPVAGKIVNLRFKTIGGIVQRGEPILDIVPAGDALIIEAQINPIDIKTVHVGLTANVHLSAYSSRMMPRLSGVVRYVSADRIIDQTTKQGYYLARVEIDRAELQAIPGVELVPGMAADILIVSEQRSMLRYLFQPLRDALRRSMREV